MLLQPAWYYDVRTMRRSEPVPIVDPMNKTTFVRVAKIIGTWLPAILLILIFAPQGWAKFSDTSGWAVAFRHWGYPAWFRVTIGVLELGAVLLLALGRTAAFGAVVILGVMLGAWGTHLVFDGGRHMTSEVVPLVLAGIVLIVRRRQLGVLRRGRL
jgi:putative oxidoreductase